MKESGTRAHTVIPFTYKVQKLAKPVGGVRGQGSGYPQGSG